MSELAKIDQLLRVRRAVHEAERNRTDVEQRLAHIRAVGGHVDQCMHAAWAAREMLRVARAAEQAAAELRTLFDQLAEAYTPEQAEIAWSRIVDAP